ncbi:unnamed protein product [Caenorhabditis sp. 36 PRJEB53466]|nr:unnamed protein product [Caenorhabditis sp. 36 PRJEB53466]
MCDNSMILNNSNSQKVNMAEKSKLAEKTDLVPQMEKKLCLDEQEPIIVNKEDFEIVKFLQSGGFGDVHQVRKTTGRDAGKIFAMKVISRKKVLEKNRKIGSMKTERRIMEAIDSSFCCKLFYSFETDQKLYLVMEYLSGGELFNIRSQRAFTEEMAQFYLAEVIVALSYLHSLNIIYRDLKTENVVLDVSGHVKLVDFGSCKDNVTGRSQAKTLCGTIEYMAPEMLLKSGHGRPVDWWSLGIFFIEMLTNRTPFYDKDSKKMKKKIFECQLILPEHMTDAAADLVKKLIVPDPDSRLGSGPTDSEEIKSHPFFNNIDWNKAAERQLEAPIKPENEDAPKAENSSENSAQDENDPFSNFAFSDT